MTTTVNDIEHIESQSTTVFRCPRFSSPTHPARHQADFFVVLVYMVINFQSWEDLFISSPPARRACALFA
jgi:hypothetical protein